MTIAPVPCNVAELQTPAPLVDAAILEANLARMAEAWPGERLPFGPALSILATVVSVNPGGWAVAGCGLKALGMDHGNPSLSDGSAVWFCSDEHVVFSPPEGGRYPRWATRSGCCRPTSTPPWPTTSACTWWRVTGSWRRGRWTCGAGEQLSQGRASPSRRNAF